GPESGLPRLVVPVTRNLAPWLDATLALHCGAEQEGTPYHEGRLGLAARSRDLQPGPPSLSLSADAFAAATALTSLDDLARPQVFGTRVGAGVEASAGTGRTAAGTPSVRVRAQATQYPNHRASQGGVALNPSWPYAAAPTT